jgi:hypothetical protein
MIHRNRAPACACVGGRVTPNHRARKRVAVLCLFADRRVFGRVKLSRQWRYCVLSVLRGIWQAYAGTDRPFHLWARGRRLRIINVDQVAICRKIGNTINSRSVEKFGYEFSQLAAVVPAARLLDDLCSFAQLFFSDHRLLFLFCRSRVAA